MPGHGKTVIVSYYLGRSAGLIGSIGTSVILVLTHVGSAVVLVLAGYLVIRRTIGGAGRAPAFEVASAILIIAIGVWLLFRALRPHEHGHAGTDGRVLAFVTGLVPCPLTTFIMVYAVAQGIVAAGLLVTAGMALGMITTIAGFALAAVLLRDRFISWSTRTTFVVKLAALCRSRARRSSSPSVHGNWQPAETIGFGGRYYSDRETEPKNEY